VPGNDLGFSQSLAEIGQQKVGHYVDRRSRVLVSSH
jgi:hypothetical protein